MLKVAIVYYLLYYHNFYVYTLTPGLHCKLLDVTKEPH